jgi:predicted nucleic acid-binding protein
MMNAMALGLALRHNRPFYDCLYLALALHNQCDLITADEKFFNAMHGSFPCIRLLREANV